MILLLTYHRISDDADGQGDFYTVTRTQLARHLQALNAAGYQPLEATKLREANRFTGRNYLLSFDDGTRDHYATVFALLWELELRAIFFVPTAKLDQQGYLTPAQVREMAAAGQTMGLHSHEHKRLDTLSDARMREQMRTSRDLLAEATGTPPWIFAPVGGFINAHVREVAQGFGVRAIRLMRWGYNETVDPLALETVSLNRHTTDAEFQAILHQRRRRSLYLGKEAVKALVPIRVYEQLRRLAFKVARKN